MDPDLTISDFFISHSYAWDDDENNNGEEYMDSLCESLKKDGFKTIRDKDDLRYKDSISEFMEERIAKARCIVVLVSDKYLKSPNCMFELLAIYKKSDSLLGEMRKKIFPVIWYDAKIRNREDRSQYGKYWDMQVEDFKKLLDEDITLSASEGQDLESYIDIANKVRKFCKFLNSINTLTPQELARNNFAVIKNAIREEIDVKPPGKRSKLLRFTFIAILFFLATSATIFFWFNQDAKGVPEKSPVVATKEESKKDSTKINGEINKKVPKRDSLVNNESSKNPIMPEPPDNEIIDPLNPCLVYWNTKGITDITMSFTKGDSTYTLVSDGSRMKLAVPCYLSNTDAEVIFTGKGQTEKCNIKLNVFEMPLLFMQ